MKNIKRLKIATGVVTFICDCGHQEVLEPITYDATTTDGTYGPGYFCCAACDEPRSYLMDAPELARQIDTPISRWPGACYGIAGAAQRFFGGKLRYGHWTGPVDDKCPVEGFKNNLPFQRHGWLALDNGSIVDPTRWVFEGTVPYIYRGPNDYYDVGGNDWRELALQPCPEYGVREPRSALAVWKFDPQAHRFVIDELFNGAPGITNSMARWLANLPLPRLGVHARAVYQALVDCGDRSWIPIDNLLLVLGED